MIMKKIIDFLGINIIVFLVGVFMGIVALFNNIGILAKLAIVVIWGSSIIDGKGHIRF